ncbi:MAG: hypothetical protein DIZ80_06710 [endosymbiont of Galathealinum brachiosum]|uniref:SPOR domain-containing protein n=1 Tax=endosymbiont of Galathealinum brachiosum TaxID=2200906 RepID=A0A370DHJ1_9GAMM|nr:MAG: hypothetical protein DIZ80_06710 [endosymbiont of Galathealinum brachiosum]
MKYQHGTHSKSQLSAIKYYHLNPSRLFKSFSIITVLLIAANFLFSTSVYAAGGRVEALQMPAWLERNGELLAIIPGMELEGGDKLTTGTSARLLLRMDEGSFVKLGENAELNLDTLIPAQQDTDIFEAALEVIKGAFRFTTSALGQKRSRKVDVRIGSITAGIRGTDIWGSSNLEKDILCLIEGKITAKKQGEPEFAMEDPLSFFIAPKNAPALPVAPVPQAKLAKWADETELKSGAGVLSIDGQWAVNLMSVASESSARPVMASLAAAGYATSIESAVVNGNNWYRLRVNGFKTRQDASAFASSIDGTNGITGTWIVRF